MTGFYTYPERTPTPVLHALSATPRSAGLQTPNSVNGRDLGPQYARRNKMNKREKAEHYITLFESSLQLAGGQALIPVGLDSGEYLRACAAVSHQPAAIFERTELGFGDD